jgi:hypothetical protein
MRVGFSTPSTSTLKSSPKEGDLVGEVPRSAKGQRPESCSLRMPYLIAMESTFCANLLTRRTGDESGTGQAAGLCGLVDRLEQSCIK